MNLRIITVVLAALVALTTFTSADAKPQKTTHKIQRVIRDVTPVFAGDLTQQLSAKRRHYSRRGGGSCNGFDRCRCGTTAARHFNLPYDYNGMNLKMARVWKGFTHTTFRVGVAGVVDHHVLAVTGGSSCAAAQVHDDAGDYTRNVCHMTFVIPGSGGGGYASNEGRRGRHQQRFAENSYNNYVQTTITP